MSSRFRTRRWDVFLGALLLALGETGCASRLWEPTREDVLQRTLPTAVQILIEEQDGRRIRSASGVAIASRPTSRGRSCFVLTSGHTVTGLSGQNRVYAVFGSHRGPGQKMPATVLAARETESMDLALLRAESDRCVAARSASGATLGESVWVVGFPFGRPMTLAGGIVSQVNTDDATDRESGSRLMVDASVSYGSSGGGVYEAREGGLIGLVEGYNTARVTARGVTPPWYIDVPVPGQTFVAPLADIRQFLKDTGHAELISPDAAHARAVDTLADGLTAGR
jgi:S1-C subfamily serine protease